MMSRYTVHDLAGIGILNEVVQEVVAHGTGACVAIAFHHIKG